MKLKKRQYFFYHYKDKGNRFLIDEYFSTPSTDKNIKENIKKCEDPDYGIADYIILFKINKIEKDKIKNYLKSLRDNYE